MRNKVVLTLALTAAILALQGCSVDDVASQVGSSLGSVSGTVVDGAGAPVVSATVRVENTGYSALTNVQGRYLLSLPLGTYTLTASHPQGGSAQATAVIETAGEPGQVDFQLDSKQISVPVQVAVTVDKPYYRAGEAVRMKLAVANPTTEAMAFTFASGQKFDFIVRDARGRLLWQWSAGKTFTAAIGEERLGPGQTWTFEASWAFTGTATAETPLLESHLSVEGFLTADPRPASAQARFEVEAPKPRVEPVEFKSIGGDSLSAWPKPAAFVIMDAEILHRVWEGIQRGNFMSEPAPPPEGDDASRPPLALPPIKPPPTVNFDDHMVLALFLGPQRSHKNVEIVQVEKLIASWLGAVANVQNRLVATYKVSDRAAEGEILAVSGLHYSPYHLVVVPRLDLPVEFRPVIGGNL